jgi:hypothetical protein
VQLQTTAEPKIRIALRASSNVLVGLGLRGVAPSKHGYHEPDHVDGDLKGRRRQDEKRAAQTAANDIWVRGQ